MNSFKVLCLASALLMTFPVSAKGEWAFVKLLRGEKPDPDFPLQRVAFVGGAVPRQMSGGVERLCGVAQWRKLQLGEKLAPGDVIRTAEGGSVVLQMTDSDSFVRITPLTVLRLVDSDTDVTPGQDAGYVVRSCRGRAFCRVWGGEWRPVLVNTVLPLHCSVKAEAGSTVDLFCPVTRQVHRVLPGKEISLGESNLPTAAVKATIVSARR